MGEGSARVSRRGLIKHGILVMSRAGRPRRPLGQPVIRGSVLVVGGRGGMVGTPGAVRVLGRTRGTTRRSTVTLVAGVRTPGVSVGVVTAVIPRTPRVIPLSLESTPVAVENLRIWMIKN